MLTCAALLVGLLAAVARAAVPGDLITSLPGYGKTATAQYSGLIPVDSANSAYLHYWFVSATTVDPTTAPVTVWLNGGPGCSSLEGFMYEQGPYSFTGEYDSNGVPLLMDNPNSWATISNMIFIESPFGVGYSYAKNGSLSNSDWTTSQNLYGFILNFFAAYPEFSKNEFFITGESYAGIYVPSFADRIRIGNAAGNPNVNLVGFAVGNGCVGEGGSCDDDNTVPVNFFHGHGMISDATYNDVIQYCGPYMNGTSDQCQDALDDAGNVGNIWIYNVYDTCGNEFVSPHHSRPRAPIHRLNKNLGDPLNCASWNSNLAQDYLNHPLVKTALHVDAVPTTGNWSVCADIDYDETSDSMLPMYPTLIENYRVLIYSGDADACVPWNGSEQWTRNLGYAVSNPYHPFTVTAGGNSWTAGFATQYTSKHGFAFITIKHAGHMVPQYEPEAALYFFTQFLSGADY